MKKRCGCYVDKDGHPVQLCPMHEGLLAARVKKAKHKVFAGIRRSNSKKRLTIYYEEKIPGGFRYWIHTRGGRRAQVEPRIVIKEILAGTATTRAMSGKDSRGGKVKRLPLLKNPLGFALRATKGQGAVLWYTGRLFSSSQTPKHYATVQAARIDGRRIAATYGNGPMRGYTLTIWTYPTRPK